MGLKRIPGFISLCLSLFLFSAGVGSASENGFLPDGLYRCELYRISNFPQLEEQYRTAGMEGTQQLSETYTGLAVAVSDGKFIDPGLPYEIEVLNDGTLRSSDNSSLKGFLENGNVIRWSCLHNHFGSLMKTETKMVLTAVSPEERNSPNLNGKYLLSEQLLGRRMTAYIENGRFYYIPEEEAPWDFLTSSAAFLIGSDGSFYSEGNVHTRTEVTYSDGRGGTETMVFDGSTEVVQQGKVDGTGLTFSYYSFTASTTGMEDEKARYVFAGVRASDANLGRD